MQANFNVMGYFIPPRRHTRQGRRGGGNCLPPSPQKKEREKKQENSGKCWGNEDNSGKFITKCVKFRLFNFSTIFHKNPWRHSADTPEKISPVCFPISMPHSIFSPVKIEQIISYQSDLLNMLIIC
jgi:hypothetical protein